MRDDQFALEMEDEERVLILGLGNLLLSDEGIGVHVVQSLMCQELSPNVEVVDGGTGGFELIEYVEGKTKLIIIDALQADAEPGSLVQLGIEELLLKKHAPFSVHEGGVIELLAHVQTLSPMPEVVVIGVVPATIEMGTNLSAIVEAQIPRIISVLKRLCERDNVLANRFPEWLSPNCPSFAKSHL